MATFVNTIDLHVTPDEAFALLTDPGHMPRWQAMHHSWPEGQPPPVAAGSRYRQKVFPPDDALALIQGVAPLMKIVAMLGGVGDIAWHVRRYESPTLLEMYGCGPMRMTITSVGRLSVIERGTRVAFENRIGGGPLRGPIAKAAARAASHVQQESLNRLRELVF